MFNKQEESDKVQGGSFKLPYFFNLVRVTGLNKHVSSKGSTLFKLELEAKSDKADFEGFERIDKKKAKGPLAEADLGIYIKSNDFKSVANLMSQLSLIAGKAGVDYDKELAPIFTQAFIVNEKGIPTELKEVTQEYLYKVVNAVVKKIMKAGYFWVFITAEEYEKGKYGNYKIQQYNIGTKKAPEFVVWCKSEACVTKTSKDGDLTVVVEGVNALGSNKGEAFHKARKVGNDWELKPFTADEYEDELDKDIDEIDDINEGEDDLPF